MRSKVRHCVPYLYTIVSSEVYVDKVEVSDTYYGDAFCEHLCFPLGTLHPVPLQIVPTMKSCDIKRSIFACHEPTNYFERIVETTFYDCRTLCSNTTAFNHPLLTTGTFCIVSQ